MTSDPVPGSSESPLSPSSGHEPNGHEPTLQYPTMQQPAVQDPAVQQPAAQHPAAQQPSRYPYGPPGYQPPSYGPNPYAGPHHGYRPGVGAPGHPQPGMLAASADRERTMDVLKAGYGEGRLTKDEFEMRAGHVMAARTYGELSALVADLPIGPVSGVVPYPPPYYPAPPRGTNGMAIAALACGIAEFFTMGLASIPAVILGHAARAQIRRSGERGDGMAITGLVLGYLGIIGWSLLLLLLVASSASSTGGPVPGPIGG